MTYKDFWREGTADLLAIFAVFLLLAPIAVAITLAVLTKNWWWLLLLMAAGPAWAACCILVDFSNPIRQGGKQT